MYPLGGPPSQKNLGGKIFSHPLRVRGVVQTFPDNSPWKEVPKTGFKILRGMEGVKISPNFVIFLLFNPFLQNGARYCQTKNWFLIYGHSRRWRNGVLLSSTNYVNRTRLHPPSDLFKLALLRCHGSHSVQIFTSCSGSWCLTYVALGGPSPQKNFGGRNFFPTP